MSLLVYCFWKYIVNYLLSYIMPTSCLRSQWLREHCVSVVNDYADIVVEYADTWEIILLWKKWKTNEKSNGVGVVVDHADMVLA